MKIKIRKPTLRGLGAKKATVTLLFVLMLTLISITALSATTTLTVTPSPYCAGSDCCISSECSCPNCSEIGETEENRSAKTEFYELDTTSDDEIPTAASFIDTDILDNDSHALTGIPTWSILTVLLTISGIIVAVMVNIKSLKQKNEDEKRSREHLKKLRNTDKNSYYKTTAILENKKRHNRGHRLSLFGTMHALVLAGVLLLIVMQNFGGKLVWFNQWVIPHAVIVACIAIAGKCTFRKFVKMPIALLLAITFTVGGSTIAFSGLDTANQNVAVHPINTDYCPCTPTYSQENEPTNNDITKKPLINNSEETRKSPDSGDDTDSGNSSSNHDVKDDDNDRDNNDLNDNESNNDDAENNNYAEEDSDDNYNTDESNIESDNNENKDTDIDNNDDNDSNSDNSEDSEVDIDMPDNDDEHEHDCSNYPPCDACGNCPMCDDTGACPECCQIGNRCGECDNCFPLAMSDGSVVYSGVGIQFSPATHQVTVNEVTTNSLSIFTNITFKPMSESAVLLDGLPHRVGIYNVTVEYKIGDIVGTASAKLEVTPATLTVTDIFPKQKVYDGTTNFSLDSYTLQGLAPDDDVYINNLATAGSTQQSDVGNYLTAFIFELTGTDTENYTLVQPEKEYIQITTRPVTVDISPHDRHVIMGSLQVTFDHSLSNIVQNDSANVNIEAVAPGVMGIGRINDWQHGLRTVTLPTFRLTGSRAHNYHIIQPENPFARINPAEGTLPIIGNPWLGETLRYGTGTIVVSDYEGYTLTQSFDAGMLRNWHRRWIADGENIEGANGTSYTISALDRTEYNNDILNSQIGLTLVSDCGNFILKQEEHTARVPFDVRLEFAQHPVRRPGDTAGITTGHADGGSAGNTTNDLFRRQVAGGTVTIHNMLSDGNMNGTGISGTKFNAQTNNRLLADISTRGATAHTFTINPDDAVDGVITIRAEYTHIGISVSTGNLGFGYQTCRQDLGWRTVTLTNIGNVSTGNISLNLTGNTGAFEISGNVTSFNSLVSHGETVGFNIRANPANHANAATGNQSNIAATNASFNANINIQYSGILFSSTATVTVRHGTQTGFARNGTSCQTTCTVSGCGRVIRQHTTGWDSPGFSVGGSGCIRTVTCRYSGCTSSNVETHITNPDNPPFTTGGSGCTRTRICRHNDCGRQIPETHVSDFRWFANNSRPNGVLLSWFSSSQCSWDRLCHGAGSTCTRRAPTTLSHDWRDHGVFGDRCYHCMMPPGGWERNQHPNFPNAQWRG